MGYPIDYISTADSYWPRNWTDIFCSGDITDPVERFSTLAYFYITQTLFECKSFFNIFLCEEFLKPFVLLELSINGRNSLLFADKHVLI